MHRTCRFKCSDLGYASQVGDRVIAGKNSGEHPTSATQRGQRGRRRLSVAERRDELIEAALERLGVEIRTGTMVKDVDRDGLHVESGGRAERIEAHTVIWGGGVTMPPVAKTIAARTQAETDSLLAAQECRSGAGLEIGW